MPGTLRSKAVVEQVHRIENAFYYQHQASPDDQQVERSPSHRGLPSGSPSSQDVASLLSPNSKAERAACGTAPCEGVLISGNGNRALAEAVALVLGVPTHNTSVGQFESGEVNVEIHAPLSGRNVYIIQSLATNSVVDVNAAVMELLLLIRKVHLLYPVSATAVIPFFGYSRQSSGRVRGSVPSAALARMITQMGLDRVVTVDLHSNQIQGYFDNVPMDNLMMVHEFAKYVSSQPWFSPEEVVVVAPDAGGVERARALADILAVPRIVTILRRCIAGDGDEDEVLLESVGEVKGFYCIVIDDIVDTARTLVAACRLLDEKGAKGISACCTHGLLSAPSPKLINSTPSLKELVVSDSIPQEEHQGKIGKLKVLSIAPLIASVIRTYERGESLEWLFPGKGYLMSKPTANGQPAAPAGLA